MRYLLIFVIILNVLDALGIIIGVISQDGSTITMKLGSAFDAALWPISIAVIATALLRIYPYGKAKALD
ncbi:hypothetical protein [Fretibacter rubidus]|uniref:hypothetical protein n=1 Tax=Fretibacter rubidus TaxID=570162 RepID=UPI00352A0D0F